MDILFTVLIFVIPIIFLLLRRRKSTKRLPPGPLGFPVIGQSLSLLKAMRSNTAEKWIQQRVEKYGPISKLSLFGTRAVLIHGQAANKFVFTSDSSILSSQQTESIRKLLGEKNLLELSGDDHKRVRDALSVFLKPDSLKRYVAKMEEEIVKHIEINWEGKQQVKFEGTLSLTDGFMLADSTHVVVVVVVIVLPLSKTLTFNIICSLLFGIERGTKRDQMMKDFQIMIEGMWSVPINLPFTSYYKSLQAANRVRKMVKELICEKRVELQNGAPPQQDLVTSLLSIRNKENQEVVSEKEAVDNAVVVMVAGHDTSSILITFLVRLLATDPDIYASVLQEQEAISKSKVTRESLTWEDLSKMKYTWRVATEMLRMVPPVFGGFRTVLKDIEYGGYTIPKDWKMFWVTSMTHLDENTFPEPAKFDPSRYETATPPYCHVPFGGGPRICPGMEFARIETLVAIHHLVTRFTWKLLAGLSYSRAPMPTPSEGLLIEIKPRNNPALPSEQASVSTSEDIDISSTMMQQPPQSAAAAGGAPPSDQQQYLAQQYMMQQQQQPVPPPQGWVPPSVPPPTHQSQQHYDSAGAQDSAEIKTLWIGDLQPWMDETQLVAIFNTSGEVLSAKVIRNKHSGQPEGYGFIEFVSRAAAERFLTTYNNTPMPNSDQPFRLNWASYGSGERRADEGPDYTVFVGDLAADVTDYVLQETFRQQYPSVKNAKVVTDRITGRAKGYGFVKFSDEGEQLRAMTEMNGAYCSSRPMRIGPAANKKPAGVQQYQKGYQEALIIGGLELITAEMIPLKCVASF
ncbi:hypothetical protein ACFE04_004975 [Oxalis oulophora]